MKMSISSEIVAGFSVLRLTIDARSDNRIPVGTAAWDASKQWYQLRFLREGERLEGIDRSQRLLLKHAERQLSHWASTSAVPRQKEPLQPWTSEFWISASRLLSTGVMLDPPKAMDGVAIADEAELLYEAIVQPIQSASASRKRLDGALTRALGGLAASTKSRMAVPAFHDASERVMRGARTASGTVILEAVNLAGRYARRDADALVSKLMRIDQALKSENGVIQIIAYTSSPGGLNGEAHMKEWMAKQITSHVYDLNRERDRLRAVAGHALSEIGSQTAFAINPASQP
jgi:hypothetical protein